MPDIPMSPLPSAANPPPYGQSPSTTYASGQPGSARFPSPPNVGGGGAPSLSAGGDTPTGGQLPAFPLYGHESPEAKSQLHLPQASSRVEQRRHPDGSMTISIGGGSSGGGFGGTSAPPSSTGAGGNHEHDTPGGGNSAGGGGGPPQDDINEANLTDVSHLLLYPDNDGNGGGTSAVDGGTQSSAPEDSGGDITEKTEV